MPCTKVCRYARVPLCYVATHAIVFVCRLFWGAPLFFGPVKTLKVRPILYYFKVLHVFLEWPCKYAV